MHTRFSAIAAIGRNRELGYGNDLLWRLKSDMARLKRLTMGHPIIMGRRTFESIGKPLPGRQNIVVSHTLPPHAGITVAHDLAEAFNIARAAQSGELFVFGGASLYKEALPVLTRLYLTEIDADAPYADVFFPPFEEFSLVRTREHGTENGLTYTFSIRDRAEHT